MKLTEESEKMVKMSRNTQFRLIKHSSENKLRIVKTSHTRAGNMTERDSGFRPTTGLGMVSDSTQGTEGLNKRKEVFSKTIKQAGFLQNMTLKDLFSQNKNGLLPEIITESKKEHEGGQKTAQFLGFN